MPTTVIPAPPQGGLSCASTIHLQAGIHASQAVLVIQSSFQRHPRVASLVQAQFTFRLESMVRRNRSMDASLRPLLRIRALAALVRPEHRWHDESTAGVKPPSFQRHPRVASLVQAQFTFRLESIVRRNRSMDASLRWHDAEGSMDASHRHSSVTPGWPLLCKHNSPSGWNPLCGRIEAWMPAFYTVVCIPTRERGNEVIVIPASPQGGLSCASTIHLQAGIHCAVEQRMEPLPSAGMTKRWPKIVLYLHRIRDALRRLFPECCDEPFFCQQHIICRRDRAEVSG